MLNKELAKIFYEIADFLEMDNIQFRPAAYRKVAFVLENLREDVQDIYLKGGKQALDKEVSGVGESIADKIEEYIKTGKIKYFSRLKKKTPIDMEKLNAIEGLGPKRIKILYQKLGIKTLDDLEKSAKKGEIASLFGFGEKTEKNILEGINFLKKSKGRFLLADILSEVQEITEKLQSLKETERISVAGSVRRGKETIGDVDLLVVTKNPEKVMKFFVSLPGVVKVWGRGETKSSIRLKQGFDVDLRVVPMKSYGSALQYFTGSKEHNIITRKLAISKGLKLNEYGVFKQNKMIAGKDEVGVYNALGIPWMPPELRENQGEIRAAICEAEGKPGGLPKLIELKDIKGDLHCHSNWGMGDYSIKELAQIAMSMGYQYLGISDHTKFLRIEKGLNEKQLLAQGKEIDKLNKDLDKRGLSFRVLKGAEVNILNEGKLDISDNVLATLDYVIAGIHSNFKMNQGTMTQRIIRAMENPYVDIISHPTGRIIQKRDEYQIDFEKVLETAKKNRIVLEINSYPRRLDLHDRNIRKAKKAGVKMAINSDTHYFNQLSFIKFGVIQARRGWAEKEDIINTWPLEKLLKYFSR